jgi:hypothetical protein
MDDPSEWKNPSKKEIDEAKRVPSIHNYGSIARGLKVGLGPAAAQTLVRNLHQRKVDLKRAVELEEERAKINFLYSKGYSVEPLYVELVSRIQDAILDTLPF